MFDWGISNHGTFYFNQLTSLYLLADDWTNANATLQAFYNGIYQKQILGNGEQVCWMTFEGIRRLISHYQPFEAARTQ